MIDEKMVFLVVDDDPVTRATVAEFLRSDGVKDILEAASGDEALTVASCCKVDFIISDWEMPGLDGLELLKAIRVQDKLRSVPFIMITSPISTERMKIADAAMSGVDGYLIKPFRKRVLLRKISDLIFQLEWKTRRGVLVIDDDESTRTLVANALGQMGYAPIHIAADGRTGFELLQAHQAEIAVVVSDWEMPQLSGLELLRKVRTTRALRHMPFIMITAESPMEYAKVTKAIESEVDQYLVKPFRLEDLESRIELVLSKAKAVEIRKIRIVNANQALDDGDLREAEQVFSSLIAETPKDIEAHLGLASVELAREPKKGFDRAVQLIQKAISFDPRRAQSHLRLVEVYESATALAKAISQLRQAIEVCPPSPELHYHLAKLYLRIGRADESTKELERTLELDREHQGARALLGLKSE